MSRFGDYDDFEGEPEQILAQGRWEHNARRALKGKRGRQVLADLREALLALPEKRLIEGAVCTVAADKRREELITEATESWAKTPPEWRSRAPWVEEADKLGEVAGREGEGVCAVGAYVWYRKVKAGADPAEAFASLPGVVDVDCDGLTATADLAKREAGMAFTLAWELAYRNDETFAKKTPEERWEAFVAWIDEQLAGEAAAA